MHARHEGLNPKPSVPKPADGGRRASSGHHQCPTGIAGTSSALQATDRCTRRGKGADTPAAGAPSPRPGTRRGTRSTSPPRRRRPPLRCCASPPGCTRTTGGPPSGWRAVLCGRRRRRHGRCGGGARRCPSTLVVVAPAAAQRGLQPLRHWRGCCGTCTRR